MGWATRAGGGGGGEKGYHLSARSVWCHPPSFVEAEPTTQASYL